MFVKRLLRLLKRSFEMEDPDVSAPAIMSAAATPGLPPEARKVLGAFPEFLSGVNEALLENEDRLKMAMRNLSLSSSELTATNFELERLNMVNRAMLESLGQALLFFDHDGICGAGFSQACLSLLEGNPAGKHVADVLRLEGMAREDFLTLIEVMFSHTMTAHSFDELAALAPQYYAHSLGLTVALSYKAMYAVDGAVTGILLVATDISQKARAQAELKAKEEQVLRTLRIAANRGSYVHFCRIIQSVFSAGGETRERDILKRDLHTLKSMASFFYLHDLSALLHELEDMLEALPEASWRQDFANIRAGYRARFDRSIDYTRWLGREIWGDAFESVEDLICLDSAQLLRFGKDLRHVMEKGEASPEIAERMFFERVASLPVQDLLSFFETQLAHFAEASGRQIRIHHDAGDDVRVFPDFYREFFDSLTHIARNIVDHAAEPPLQRRTRGKPPELQVHIRTNYENGSRDKFQLIIADDGRGISREQVSRKLRQKGGAADGLRDNDIIQHVFDEDFSTRDAADMHAGRGVGMYVIKAEAQKLGGSVRVDSQEGLGTTLTISLPVLWDRRQSKR
ncbi:MAG: hypothetical protein EPN97_07680 [Alphaproteobacteria bacterium]|nr:MAG: hypothetical protein EPN97_07680 [Alphaproteobacteria bacterium]